MKNLIWLLALLLFAGCSEATKSVSGTPATIPSATHTITGVLRDNTPNQSVSANYYVILDNDTNMNNGYTRYHIGQTRIQQAFSITVTGNSYYIYGFKDTTWNGTFNSFDPYFSPPQLINTSADLNVGTLIMTTQLP